MAARNISATVQIGATMASSVGSVFGGVKKQIDGLGASMAKLKKSSSEITKLQAAQGKLAQAQAKGNTTAAKRYQAEVDKLSASLREAGVDTSKLTQEQARLNRQLDDGQRRMAGLTRMQGGIKGLGSAFGSLKTAMGGALMRLGVVGGVAAGAVAGVAALTAGFVDQGDALADQAEGLGMSTEALQTWQFAAGTVGVESDRLAGVIAKLQAKIADGSDKTAETFAKLGLSVKRLKALSPDAQLSVIAEAFARLPEGVNKSALATEVFGKMGFKLVPVLAKGQKGLEALNAEARKTGYILDGETNAAIGDADAALNRLKMAFTGLKNQALAPLLPAFTALSVQLGAILERNAPAITKWAEGFGENLEQNLVPAIGSFVEKDLPGLVSGLGEFVTTIGKIVSASADAVGGWGNLGAVLLGLNFAPVIVALGGIVKGLGGIAMGVWAVLGPWALLIGAVIAGAVAVWYYWEPIKKFFSDLWDGLSGDAKMMWDTLTLGVKEFKDQFVAVWESIKSSVGAVIDWHLDKLRSLLSMFDSIGGWFGKTIGLTGDGSYSPAGAAPLDAAGIPGGAIMPPEQMPAAGAGGQVTNNVEVKIDARGADGAEVERRLRSALQARPLYDQTGVLAPQ